MTGSDAHPVPPDAVVDPQVNDGVFTVIVAAGSGQRFGTDKLAVAVRGEETVLDLSVRQARRCSEGVVVVVRPGHPLLSRPHPSGLAVVSGGASRSASVRCGLAAVPARARYVLVHDAARPLADDGVYRRVIAALMAGAAAVVPTVGLVDTVRSVDGRPVDREELRAVQTPQGFAAAILREAHAGGGDATDDATLVEALGTEVVLVDGDVRNLKVTRPADIDVVRAHLREHP